MHEAIREAWLRRDKASSYLSEQHAHTHTNTHTHRTTLAGPGPPHLPTMLR
jgi:hypothetical protein